MSDESKKVFRFISRVSHLPLSRSGLQPVIYTEALNSEQLMLVITSLTDTMAGNYFCSASYANSEMLEAKVKVETYGE
jgi:neural cell adhesion molecule